VFLHSLDPNRTYERAVEGFRPGGSGGAASIFYRAADVTDVEIRDAIKSIVDALGQHLWAMKGKYCH
jgi:hypothetical protein